MFLQTDYFHLFLCVAIIVLYGEDVMEQQLATDQMLLHFSNLSMHMNGELVLRKVLLQWLCLYPEPPASAALQAKPLFSEFLTLQLCFYWFSPNLGSRSCCKPPSEALSCCQAVQRINDLHLCFSARSLIFIYAVFVPLQSQAAPLR